MNLTTALRHRGRRLACFRARAGIVARALMLALVACLAVQTVRAADNTLYANNWEAPFTVYTVNTTTGALTNVGTLSFSSIAMARRSSDGMIFYTEYNVTNGRVSSWNPATNVNTLIGRVGKNIPDFPKLAFDLTGTLYAMDDQSHLYTVSTTNGTATNVGTITGLPNDIRGDIAFGPDGTLYAVQETTSRLYTINIIAKTATAIGLLGQTNLAGLAFAGGGKLYGVESNSPDDFQTINPATGASTVVASQAIDLYDLAGMPKYADLSITKTSASTFVVGSNAAYNLSVTNNGPHSASGPITVTDTLPSGLTYVSGTGTGWTCSVTSGVVTCTTPGPVANGTTLPAITLTVGVGAAAAPSVTNTASVSSTTFDHVAANDSSSVTKAVALPTDLTINKSHTGNFTQGQNGTYTIVVTNSGGVASSGTVTVTDTLPAGLTPSPATGTGWTCSISGQTVTCTRSDALNGGSSYPAISVPVSVASNSALSLTNTASVSGGNDSNTGNNSDADPTTINAATDLTITKTHVGNFTQGQNGTYTITVANAGGLASSGTVTVTDILPAGLAPGTPTGTGWTCSVSVQTVTCTRSDALAASGSYPPISVPVSVASNSALSLTNTASVSGGNDSNSGNNTASNPTTINGVADLTIAKTHVGNFTQGQASASYTLTITNAGGAATSGTVTVTDTVPTGLSSPTGSGTGWTCNTSGQTVTCTRSDALAASGSYPVITLTVNVATNAPSSVTNTATVSGGGQTNTGNDSSSNPTTINGVPDLTITKTHTGNFTRGQNGTYTITVSNAGGAATSGVVTVTDTLPAGLAPTTPTGGTGWTCNTSGQTVTCTRSDALAASGSYPAITVTVNVLSGALSSVTNTATVSGGGQTNTGNDTANDPTTVVSSADLSLTKTANNPSPIRGQNVTFTVTLSNAGPSNATNIVVRDSLPAGLTLISATPSVGSYNSTTGAWSVASLSSAATATLQIVAQVNSTGAITNTAEVTASDQPDPDSTPNNNNATEDDQASATIGALAPPNVVLVKSVTPNGIQRPGTDLTYTIVFSNTGGSSASTLIIADKIPLPTQFKLGTVTYSAGTSGLPAPIIEYTIQPRDPASDDPPATWVNYTPAGVSGTYDSQITYLRVRFASGNLNPNTSGSISFTVRIP